MELGAWNLEFCGSDKIPKRRVALCTAEENASAALLFAEADAQQFEELGVARSQLQLSGLDWHALGSAFVFPIGSGIPLPPLIEADGRFEHKKDVVTRPANIGDGIGDGFGLLERLVDRHSQLFHQLFEVVIEFHVLPSLLGDVFSLPTTLSATPRRSAIPNRISLLILGGSSSSVNAEPRRDSEPRSRRAGEWARSLTIRR